MFPTLVRCSVPDCGEPAVSKIAAPWHYDRFAELKTYGFACHQHVAEVLELASRRPRPRFFAPGEQVGAIGSYPLPSP